MVLDYNTGPKIPIIWYFKTFLVGEIRTLLCEKLVKPVVGKFLNIQQTKNDYIHKREKKTQ